MGNVRRLRLSLVVLVTALTLLAAFAPALADDDITVFPAGFACEFSLQSDTSQFEQTDRVISNPRGDVVHGIYYGYGDITFTNLSTGKSIVKNLGGAVLHDRYYNDGTILSTMTGEFMIVLYPTDTPAGPSTRIYNGRMNYRTDVDGNWIVLNFRGTSFDVCAALTN